MHWFHKTPQVDLLAREGDTLFLQCDRPLEDTTWAVASVAHQEVHLRLHILDEIPPEGDCHGHWGRCWHSEFSRLLDRLGLAPRKFVYRALLAGPQEFTPYFRILLEPAPSDQLDERRAPRMCHHLRVRPIDFRDFTAQLHDLSVTGVGLKVSKPLPKGHVLSFHMDPDDSGNQPFSLTAEVAWCRVDPEGQGKYWEVGAFFRDMNAGLQQRLKRYVDYLRNQEDTGLQVSTG